MKAVTMAAFLLAGCTAAGGGSDRIGLGEWVARDINGMPVVSGPVTFRLEKGGRASGSGGCNSWSAPYDLKAREGIRIGPVTSTRKACEPAVMEQENRYFEILRLAQGYSFYSDRSLSLIAADGRAVRFRSR
ncbi:MAG TPA: META domain-containing protein [Allosphingosinicella sp.]|jgi:heat shock protein HslJ